MGGFGPSLYIISGVHDVMLCLEHGPAIHLSLKKPAEIPSGNDLELFFISCDETKRTTRCGQEQCKAFVRGAAS